MQDETKKTEPCKNNESRSKDCLSCPDIWKCDVVDGYEAKMWKRFRQGWRV